MAVAGLDRKASPVAVVPRPVPSEQVRWLAPLPPVSCKVFSNKDLGVYPG